MERTHKEALRKNRVYLVKHIMMDMIYSYLVDYGVFTDDMVEAIQMAGTSLQQKQRMLSDLPRRGPHAYDLFLNCLQDSGQGFIADQIRHTAAGNEGELPKSRSSSSAGVIGPGHLAPATRSQSARYAPQNMTEQQTYTKYTNFSQGIVTQEENRHGSCRHDEPMEGVSTECEPGAGPVNGPTPESEMVVSGGQKAGQRKATQRAQVPVPVKQEPIDHPMRERLTRPPMTRYPDPELFESIPLTHGHMNLPEVPPVQDEQRYHRLQDDPDKVYKVNSNPSGYCLIINNRKFTGKVLGERMGTDTDRDNLNRLFRYLNYEISSHENLTGEEIMDITEQFSQNKAHNHVDSCVVAFLTHGENDGIYGVDETLVKLDKLIALFDGSKCAALQGKPKLFIVQACRGQSLDKGFDMTDTLPTNQTHDVASQIMASMTQLNLEDVNGLRNKLPTLSDMLIAYATIPGYVSWRNSENGSWFIQSIFEIFSNQCQAEDLLAMMTMVNDKVATAYESKQGHQAGCRQMPAPVTTLRKKWFFKSTN